MLRNAHSTVKCNRQVKENLAWGLVAEYLAGAGVEFVLDPLDVVVRQRREVCAFWEVLPDEAVCVFIEATFPRVIRLRKVGFGTQCGDDFGVGGESFPLS
jgi:hypothetical protein